MNPSRLDHRLGAMATSKNKTSGYTADYTYIHIHTSVHYVLLHCTTVVQYTFVQVLQAGDAKDLRPREEEQQKDDCTLWR